MTQETKTSPSDLSWPLLAAAWFLSGMLPFLWLKSAGRRRFGRQWSGSAGSGIRLSKGDLLLASYVCLITGPICVFSFVAAIEECIARPFARAFSAWCGEDVFPPARR